MAMNSTRIDWARRHAQIIAENSNILPDVTFKIMDDWDVDYVKAHKMILAMASPVFGNMFYVHNTTDKTAKEILILHTTKPAFQIMINAIYDITLMTDSLKGKAAGEVFQVLYLVIKYEIPELIQAVEEYLASFPLTKNTVVDVAADAIMYKETFEKQAKDLLLLCAKFLKNKLKHAASVFRFVADNTDDMATVNELQILMHSLAPPKYLTPPKCTKFNWCLGQLSPSQCTDCILEDYLRNKDYINIFN